MSWNNLSMTDRAAYIKLGLDNGITDLNTIRNIYNEYDNGGFLSKIKDTSKEIIDKIGTIKDNFTLDKDTIMNRFYNHFDPYMSYSDEGVKRAINLIIGGPQYAKDNFPKEKNGFPVYYNEGATTPFDDAVWGTYLNIPVSDRKYKTSLEESEYKPSKGSSNTKYYRIPIDNKTKKSIINTGSKLKIGENTLSKDLFGYNMGTSTVGRGIDKDKGEYISYYDKWDINPLHGDYVENTLKEKYPILSKLIPSSGEDVFKGMTSPVSFYDRIYLDDYYGVKTNTLGGDTYFGGYLPEIIVTPYSGVM